MCEYARIKCMISIVWSLERFESPHTFLCAHCLLLCCLFASTSFLIFILLLSAALHLSCLLHSSPRSPYELPLSSPSTAAPSQPAPSNPFSSPSVQACCLQQGCNPFALWGKMTPTMNRYLEHAILAMGRELELALKVGIPFCSSIPEKTSTSKKKTQLLGRVQILILYKISCNCDLGSTMSRATKHESSLIFRQRNIAVELVLIREPESLSKCHQGMSRHRAH